MTLAVDHKSVKARCVLPGRTYLVTRRTIGRKFLLRPGPAINQIFRYALAKAKARTKGVVLVHAFKVMSNHIHLVVTDVTAVLPKFMQLLCGEIARAASAECGHWGGLFDKRQYSRVQLLTCPRLG